MRNKFIYIILLLAFCIDLSGQVRGKIDSLLKQLPLVEKDSGKVMLLSKLCAGHTFSDPAKAIELGQEGILLADELKFPTGKADCYFNIGVVYYYQGKYDKSLDSYLKSLRILENLPEKNTGIRKKIGHNLENTGKVYYRQYHYTKSLASFNRALIIFQELDHKSGIASCNNNMAGVYHAQKDIDKALHHLRKFLEIAEEAGNKSQIATGTNNIGLMYKDQEKHDQALIYLLKALEIRKETEDIKGLAYSYTDVGGIHLKSGNYNKSLEYFLKGLEYATMTGAKERIRASYESLAKTYAHLQQYDKAYQYQQALMELKDSIFNKESASRMAEMSEKYESEKKQHQIELLEQGKKLQAIQVAKSTAEAKKQEFQKYTFAFGFILVLFLVFLVLYNYRRKQKDHQQMSFQKAIIEEKHKEITDSILYAKRIQEALLKDESHISGHLPPHFIFFKPKDVVSGDFYWALEKQGHLYLTVGDCTGHGVPGAFLTMLGTAFLNEINATDELLSPAFILDRLREKILKELNQTGEDDSTKDGMDISMIRLHLKSNELQYAGANNPLWIISANHTALAENMLPVGEALYPVRTSGPDLIERKPDLSAGKASLFEIKADKEPIGYQSKMKPFSNHTVPLCPGDTIYLFSDGFSDQFGGEKGKKFKSANFKKLLLSLRDKSLEEQKQIINKQFEKWRGHLDQVDDVCVIGMRV